MACNSMWLLFFLLFEVFCYKIGNCQELNDDVLGLIVFKAGLEDPNGALNSWNEDDETPCKWKYIRCSRSTGRVTEVILEGLSLSGKIGRGLEKVEYLRKFSISRNNFSGNLNLYNAQIPGLRSLNLSYNRFSGMIPSGLGSNMSSLRSLDLSNNKLSGSIPDEIFVSTLRTLSLANNVLPGSVPNALERCYYLKILNLSKNNFTSFSSSGFLSNLVNLRVIDLSYNKFSGPLPIGFGRLLSLREVYVQKNGFSGFFPNNIGECSQLSKMDFSQNALVGELPQSLQGLYLLESLKLQGNKLNGGLANWIANLSSLREIDLSNNGFSGNLPSSLGKLKSLKELHLGNNLFAGSIPLALGNCLNLSSLDISNNNLEGGIPKEVFDLGLQRVNMSFNNLSGHIPDGSPTLYWYLKELDLSNNMLKGAIPVNVSLCFNMKYINLSWNSLHASIPPELGDLRFLRILDISHNKLFGSIPPKMFNSGSFVFLQLDHNSLTGQIPLEISNCSSLYSLSLSHNHLQGPIPLELTKLGSLSSLDLSSNNLTGILPRALARLRNLIALNVSFNQLEGRIPTEGIFKTLNISAFEGNSRLCGGVFNLSCTRFIPKPIVINPHARGFGQGGSSGALKSIHRKFILSPSAIVAICGACAIFIGIIIVTVLNIRTQRQLIPGDSPVESGEMTSSSASPAGKLVMFASGSDPVLEKWMLGVHERLKKGTEIGKGGFGTVYRVALEDGRTIAVKKLLVSGIIKSQEDFDRELQLLGKLRHPNLVTLKGYYWTPQSQLLFYEYVPNGSLYNRLHEKSGLVAAMNWQMRFKIALGIAKGLAYLHEALTSPIIHYSLKSSNVLLDEDFNPRISDYGLAKLLPVIDKYILSSKFQSGLGYVAPEFACQSLKINEKCDVFGFGVIVLELVTGRRPVEYMEDDVVILCDYVRSLHDQGDIASCVDPMLYSCSQTEIMSFFKLGMACTSQVPSSRPSMGEVLQMLQGIDIPVESIDRF